MRVIENAVVRLLIRRPFYGHLLLGLRRRPVSAGEAAVGITICHGTPTLLVDPAAFATFSAAEQEALLEHLLKHLLHLHPLRRKERHGGTWDLACDLAINPGIADLPAGVARPERYHLAVGWSAEEYYRHLHRPLASGNLDGAGFGDAEQDTGTHIGDGEETVRQRDAAATALDTHQCWQEADSTPQQLAEEVVRRLVVEASRRSAGEIPGELQPLIQRWLQPPLLPWPQILRQFVATAGRVGRTTTWKREHRRFGHDTPGLRKRRRLDLLIGVDVSDSTNQRPLREAFAREVLNIARGRDSRITVLYAGSRIQQISTFSHAPAVVEVYSGGGFTDLRPVFAHARSMQPRPAAVIYLTDGYGTAPEHPDFPTLWVLTAAGRKPAPWGIELRLSA